MTEAMLQQRLVNVEAIAARRRSTTHCPHGHEYTPKNTYRARGVGPRRCRICRADNEAARRLRLKLAAIIEHTREELG